MMKSQSDFDESESKDRDNKVKQSRLDIEQMLLSLALKFIEIDSEDIDQAIEETLWEIANFFQAQRCYIYLYQKNQTCLVLTHQYTQKGINGKIRQHEQVDKEDFQWLTNSILNNKSITLASVADLPAKANTIKLFMEIENTQSMMLYPLTHQETVLGLVGLDTVGQKRTFSSDEQYLFDKSCAIFAEAIQRRKKAHSEVLLEHKYKNLFAEIEDVVFISNPEGKLLEINAAGAKLFGYSSVQELLNINIEQDLYQNSQDRAEYQKAMKIRGHLKNYELTRDYRLSGYTA
jgi:transcriptional regulator with GAF, ATPase, and Fis domain